ncbi:MAG: amidohydrolase [Candidatus Pelagadaptatus aseana]|uniref:amidohydrolase n=1 Tax=Candidatus Pelagadaptatus aseana TaxID=3120508 RepID=UPI0039B1ADF3
MKKTLIVLSTLVVMAGLLIHQYLRPASAPASQIFINATVLTMDSDNTTAEAVALEGNKIVAIGSNQEISQRIRSDSLVYDLQGKTLMPGFIDAHGHFPASGLFAVHADLRSPPMGQITSLNQLQQILSNKLTTKAPGEWVVGTGYDDTLLAERRHPTRQDLDAVSSEHPIFIVHTSLHMGVANTLALETLGITRDTPNPVGGVIAKDPDTGELTGLLEETAINATMQQAMDFSLSELRLLLTTAIDEYAAAGVTLAQNGGAPSTMLKGVSLVSKLNLIPFRLELWPMLNKQDPDQFQALMQGDFSGGDYESDLSRVNRVKVIADGSIQGYTGYLSKPYHTHFRNNPYYRGYPTQPRDELVKQVSALHQQGYRIAIHGNGDAAIDDIIYAFAKALEQRPDPDPRFIVIHSQMAREDQLLKMKQLGITPSFFSAHTYYWGDRHRDFFMGPIRAARMSPTKSAENLGLPYSVHMDTPVAPMEPLTLVWSTVNRVSTSGRVIGKEQRVSAQQALRAVTIDAAYQIFRDHELGSIEVGKLADLVVLSQNPMAVDPMAIKDIEVTQTIVNGVTIFSNES